MNQKITAYINNIFQVVFLGLALILPLFFWNLTSEFYETPKLLLLTIVTLILLALWVVKFVVGGRVIITRTALDLPFLLLLLSLIVSTFFAASRHVAILGNIPQVHGGLGSYIIYILFYFLLVSNLKKIGLVKQIIYLLTGSGIILSIVTLLSYFGVYLLPLPFTNTTIFTPTGANFSTNALLAMLIPFLMISILYQIKGDLVSEQLTGSVKAKGLNIVKNIIYSLILVLFTATIALTGSWTIYLPTLLAIGIVVLIAPRVQVEKNIFFILVPVVVAVLLVLFSSFPLAGSKNFLHARAQSFPREIQLPFSISWKISVSAFRDMPFYGSGPASYLSNFTTYKPIEFNATKFWNNRFSSAFNEYLQFLATLGAPGLIILLLLTVVFISKAIRSLTSSPDELTVALASAGLVFFAILALHSSTFMVWVVGIIILASFMVIRKETKEELQIGIATSLPERQGSLGGDESLRYLRFDLLPTLLLLITLIIVGGGLYYTGKFALADYYHRQALNSVALGQGLEAYNQLVKAESLNPGVDLYHTDLAQTNFALANAIALSKGPTEASPTGTLTDEDKQNIQLLLSQSINEGRIAVASNPNNPTNWEILGSIYRQISGVAQNALEFALDSYGRAIQKDPLNPLLRLSVGGIYYSVKDYDTAIRFFTDAINLKSDYANAYYNLTIALRDKGDINNAIMVAEKTVSLIDPKSVDYEMASKLLADLQEIASKSAALKSTPSEDSDSKAKSPTKSSTLQNEAQKSSALQDKNMPKVLDLPKAENIATPPAVKATEEE